MEKKGLKINSYGDLPVRLKPLGVTLGDSTAGAVELSIKEHRGTISYSDTDTNNPEIRYIFGTDLSHIFRLPSQVSEIRCVFFKDVLSNLLLAFPLNDDLDFFRVLRDLKRLYGKPKMTGIRFARWDYGGFWMSFREDKESDEMVLEYAHRSLITAAQGPGASEEVQRES